MTYQLVLLLLGVGTPFKEFNRKKPGMVDYEGEMKEIRSLQPLHTLPSDSYDDTSMSEDDQEYGEKLIPSPISPTMWGGSKKRSLRKLADLSAGLFKQLNSIRSGPNRMGEEIYPTPNSAGTTGSSSVNFFQSPKNSV
jgi:hypothetical protein